MVPDDRGRSVRLLPSSSCCCRQHDVGRAHSDDIRNRCSLADAASRTDWIIGLIDTAEVYTAPYEGPSRQLAAALLANDDLIEGTDSPFQPLICSSARYCSQGGGPKRCVGLFECRRVGNGL